MPSWSLVHLNAGLLGEVSRRLLPRLLWRACCLVLVLSSAVTSGACAVRFVVVARVSLVGSGLRAGPSTRGGGRGWPKE